MKNEKNEKEIEMIKLKNLIKKLDEQQNIFEYLLSKFSPDLLNKMKEISVLPPEVISKGSNMTIENIENKFNNSKNNLIKQIV
jgi:hypothetical protein